MFGYAVGGGSTTAAGLGTGTPSGTGTGTGVGIAHSSKYAAYRKIEYLVTTPASNAVAGVKASAAIVARGVAGYPNSGFSCTIRCGPATGLTGAGSTHRYFQGLRGSTSAPTDVNPSTLTDIIGIGWDAADTNVFLMHNDSSGTATRVDLGVARPNTDRTSSSGVLYQLDLSCSAAGSSIAWSLTELVAGTLIGSGTVTTNLVTATTELAPYVYASVGGTSSVVGVAFMDFYVESNNT